MTESSRSVDRGGAPYRETILKQNRYKCVCLAENNEGRKFIIKQYRGHPDEYSTVNTQYVYDTLLFFHREFLDILTTPTPYDIDIETHSVVMEYLDKLPTAKILNRRTLCHATSFFEKCYSVRANQEFLRQMSGSVYFIQSIKSMLSSGFPTSLGFKGDLWQNLCLAKQDLMLADVDSAAIEPLGLSELIMYCEIAASFRPGNAMAFSRWQLPICFRHLDQRQAIIISEAAQEIFQLRMQHLPKFVVCIKSILAKRMLSSALQRAFPK